MIRRIGRPGLIGLAARTAVVAGTATAVSGGVARNQQRRAQKTYEPQQYEAAQAAMVAPAEPAATPAPAAPDHSNLVTRLQNLAALKSVGALTDEEFEAAKAKLLG